MDKPFTDDEISQALTDAGIPSNLHTEFISFQKKYGGRRDAFGLNPVIWGILHRNSKWVLPCQIDAGVEATGLWSVLCADVHPSDFVSIDQNGRLYWSGRPVVQHFDDYFTGKPPSSSIGMFEV